MPIRSLPRILQATPGVLGPLLAWSARRYVDPAVTARRIRGLGVISREVFVAVATCTVRSNQLQAMTEAWPGA